MNNSVVSPVYKLSRTIVRDKLNYRKRGIGFLDSRAPIIHETELNYLSLIVFFIRESREAAEDRALRANPAFLLLLREERKRKLIIMRGKRTTNRASTSATVIFVHRIIRLANIDNLTFLSFFFNNFIRIIIYNFT